jgi:hypothetical protein
MVTEQVRVLPINVQSFEGPAVRPCRGADQGALGLGAVFTKTGAVIGNGKEWIPARPSVRAGTELISEP